MHVICHNLISYCWKLITLSVLDFKLIVDIEHVLQNFVSDGSTIRRTNIMRTRFTISKTSHGMKQGPRDMYSRLIAVRILIAE